MKHFVTISDEGQFTLEGRRWYCNSVVYFGHYPGHAGGHWLADGYWERNEPLLDRDFGRMAEMGLNHAAMFFLSDFFFEDGRILEKGMRRLDRILDAARKAGIRGTIFVGPFIDTPAEYRRITGREWEHDDRFLPSFNPALHEAYVLQMQPFAERYKDDPTVLAYTDRIDRFHKGFDNDTIPFNLKEEWIAHLQRKFGAFSTFMKDMGGPDALENRPADWSEVLLPQESRYNASLKNPLGYEYILWQKQSIGEAQARFDAAINDVAPNQFVWTPFEGNTNTWAMLDGFSPETKQLQAVWMEYYYFEVVRAAPVQPFHEWVHTREVIHRRIAHELPVVYNAAYMMTRYLKQSVQRPVVICHGGMIDQRSYGIENDEQQMAILDRVNAACLAADGDGWHYWSYTDDHQSLSSHKREQKANPTHFYWYGESTGLYDWDDDPRPATAVVAQYSHELSRRAAANRPPKHSDVLLLSSAPRMNNLFRRLAYHTAAAVSGALARCGVECDYRWSAQNAVKIAQETLEDYRFIVIADNMYERDFRDMPEKLLRFVENGGTLYLSLARWDGFYDEHGVPFDSPALTRLSGVDPNGWTDWPAAREVCKNWPNPTDPAQEPNEDIQSFPRISWGICPDFRHLSPVSHRVQLLGWKSMDGDTYTVIPGLVEGAEVIAVAKFPAGSRPFIYRHRIGKGTVYVNAWTNNIFRDSESRNDYGGAEYDWVLSIPLAESGARDVDLTGGAGLWLRNTWGYFWKTM